MNAAVIVAAGKGTRMGAQVDKLFIELAGRPIIAHTWQRFDSCPAIDQVILVVREGMETEFHSIARTLNLSKRWSLVKGGAERQDSVWNGLQALEDKISVVAIHDGARPCISHGLIAEVISTAAKTGAAVAAQKVTDTLKESRDGSVIARNVDRTFIWSVQTPQAFHPDVIVRALNEVKARGLAVTDDTAACELIGQPVRLVDCKSPNPKATTKADLAFMEMLLSRGLD